MASLGEKYFISVLCICIYRNVPRNMYCLGGWVFLLAFWVMVCPLSFILYIGQIPRSETWVTGYVQYKIYLLPTNCPCYKQNILPENINMNI